MPVFVLCRTFFPKTDISPSLCTREVEVSPRKRALKPVVGPQVSCTGGSVRIVAGFLVPRSQYPGFQQLVHRHLPLQHRVLRQLAL